MNKTILQTIGIIVLAYAGYGMYHGHFSTLHESGGVNFNSIGLGLMALGFFALHKGLK